MVDAFWSHARFWLGALTTALFGALALRAHDFGVTWDEGLQADLGLCSWAFARRGDRSYERLMWDVANFPPLIEMLLTAPTEWWGAPLFTSRRALLVAISGGGLVSLWRLAALLKLEDYDKEDQPSRGESGRLPPNGVLPALSALALLGLPRFVGDAVANSKDAAFAAAFVSALPPLALFLGGGLRPGRAAVWSALALAVATCCRVQGMVLLPMLAGAAALELCRGWAAARALAHVGVQGGGSGGGCSRSWATVSHATAAVAMGCSVVAGADSVHAAARFCIAAVLVSAPFAVTALHAWQSCVSAGSHHGSCCNAALRLEPCALLTAGAMVGATVVLALALVLVCWPALDFSPSALLHTLLANLLSRTYGATEGIVSDVPTLYAGHTMLSSALPWSYAPRMLALTTPLPSLALALLGAAALLGKLGSAEGRAQHCDLSSTAHAARALVAMWLLLPIAVVLVARPNLYDGTRHLLFLQPCLALLAGVGASRCLCHAQRALPGRSGTAAALSCAVVLLLSSAPEMWRLHPHQSAFFNGIAGGVAGVAGQPDGVRSVHCGYGEKSADGAGQPLALHCARYDTDYHVASYAEAARWVAARHAEASKDRRDDSNTTSTTVVVSANHLSIDAFTSALPLPHRAHIRVLRSFSALSDPNRPGPLPLTLPADVDYFVSTPRFGLDTLFAQEPIAARLGRSGATFCIIKRNDSARKRARAAAVRAQCERALRVLYGQLDPSRLGSVPVLCGSIYSTETGWKQLLMLLRNAGVDGVIEIEAELAHDTQRELLALRGSGEAARTLFLRAAPPDRWRNVTCGVHHRDLW